MRNSQLLGYGHQIQLQTYIYTASEIYDVCKNLIDEMWHGEPIRQLGVHVSGFPEDNQIQLSLFDNSNREKQEALETAVDAVRKRYGNYSIIRGTFANTGVKPIEGGVNDGNYLMMGGYKQ